MKNIKNIRLLSCVSAACLIMVSVPALLGFALLMPAPAQAQGGKCSGEYNYNEQFDECQAPAPSGNKQCPAGGEREGNPATGSGQGGADICVKPAEGNEDATISEDFGRRNKPEGAETCGSPEKSTVHTGNGGNKGVPIAIKVGCSGSGNPIYDYAKGFIRFLTAGVGIVVVGAIIFGGITYASARGDQSQTQKGIEIITNAVIALVIFLLMAAILNFIIPGGLL